VDAAIGRVLDEVRRTTGREPAVVVTADHGESLFDEGFLGHGYALNEVQTRVPLVVSGLPMVIGQPWGQAALRGELLDAMASGSGEGPRLVEASAPLFQYLGKLARPRQIAFTQGGARSIYDFRDGRFRSGDGPWRRPAQLEGPERDTFLRLVRHWESMVLATARGVRG